MAKTVYVVYDREIKKLIGVFDNAEAADEAENAFGDRFTQKFELAKAYDEEKDPSFSTPDEDDEDDMEKEEFLSDEEEDEEEELSFVEPPRERLDPYGR